MLPVVSGLLVAASFPPLHLVVLPFVALVPVTAYVHGLPDTDVGRRSALRGGILFGVVHFGLLLYWIPVALVWLTPLAIPAYLGVVAGLALLSGLFARVLHAGVHDARIPLWLALPVAWTAVEWCRAHLPDALAFPWLGLGSSLAGYPRAVGFAELVGERGVGFWIAAVNGLVATFFLRSGRGALRARVGIALVLVTCVPPAWGLWRAQTLPLREVARVAVVQPNISEPLRLEGGHGVLDSTRTSLEALLPSIAGDLLDVVVLPEVLFPGLYPELSEGDPPMDFLVEWSRSLEAPLIFGGLGASTDAGGRRVTYNSAFLIGAEGLSDFRYDKHALVPGVERVPFVPRGWLGRLGLHGGYGVGEGWPLARVGAVRIGTLVCYESSYPRLARRFRLEGADLLVNLTNDAWFGREPWYARTAALWQHPAHLVLRAIENRVGIARAANSGISLFVDPLGRVHGATELFRPVVTTATVLGTDGTTFYTRFGDLVGNGAALAALALLLAPALSRGAERKTEGSPSPGRDLDRHRHRD